MSTPRQKRINIVTNSGATVTLTPKQKEYADKKMANPEQSLASIAREVYPNANPDTARQLVHRNEQNKNIALYSNEQLKDAQTYIHGLINNPEAKDRDRLTAAFRVEDRNLGTVVQQVQTTGVSVQFSIDLSQAVTELEQRSTPQ
jgi:hypothetical protein